ncbi:hypothetical protein Bhyg_01564, partial [Pseudolycoriella hygida]
MGSVGSSRSSFKNNEIEDESLSNLHMKFTTKHNTSPKTQYRSKQNIDSPGNYDSYVEKVRLIGL